MKQLTLKNPKYLPSDSPADELKYGKSYWSYTYDSETPVMFNLLEGEVQDGTVINAEEVMLKTSKKGTEYHRLKKVRISGSQPSNSSAQRQSAAPANDTDKLLELIFDNTDKTLKLVQKLAGEDEPQSLADAWRSATKEPDNVVEDIGDEPMNINDIPF